MACKAPRLRPALALSGGKFTNPRKEHLVVSFSGGVFRLAASRSSCVVTFLTAELCGLERRYEMSRQRASAFVVDATPDAREPPPSPNTAASVGPPPHVVRPAGACRRMARQKTCSEHCSGRQARSQSREHDLVPGAVCRRDARKETCPNTGACTVRPPHCIVSVGRCA